MNSPAANEDWADSVRCELAGEILQTSGSVRLQVNGWSMLPAIWPGDTLEIQAADHTGIATGDIVLFERCGRMFVHRVVANALRDHVLTRGDSMAHADPPVPNRSVLGKVQFIVRHGRRIEPAGKLRPPERAIAGLVQRWNIAGRAVMNLRSMLQA
jgi:hypothetical protein